MLKEIVKEFVKKGVSLKSISTLSDIHYTTLSKWINDKREMNEKNQEKVKNSLIIIVKELQQLLKNL